MQNLHKYEILVILINAHLLITSIMLNKSILMAAIDIKCYTDILHASFNTLADSPTDTVNDKSLEWLKFGGFGELIKFTKLSSTNLL